MLYSLPSLPYAYDALAPHFDAHTMEIHHTKHHQTYVDKLNEAVSNHEVKDLALETLLPLVGSLPAAIRNNAGGHYNHSLFWTLLSPAPRHTPEGALLAAINQRWGSVEAFQQAFEKEALSRFGSGWVWLVRTADGALHITSTPNQDNPLMPGDGQGFPLLGLDVWEHAYYLHYQNRRADYVKAFWQVLNWAAVEQRFAEQPA